MPRGAVRVGDMSTGHSTATCTWPPTAYVKPVVTTQVYVNGSLAGAIGDMFLQHKGIPCNIWHWGPSTPRPITTGSSSVNCHGSPMARIGDMIEFDYIAQGSHNVFVGG
jgi:uncharacterized Zn-binding protein involved in type VI secretion